MRRNIHEAQLILGLIIITIMAIARGLQLLLW